MLKQLAPVARPAAGASATDAQAIGVETQLEGFAEADEGIAAEPLAALDALQQIARRSGGELQIRRDRRIGVRDDVEKRCCMRQSLQSGMREAGNKKPIPRACRRWVSRIVSLHERS